MNIAGIARFSIPGRRLMIIVLFLIGVKLLSG
jgi:hypothetical protein